MALAYDYPRCYGLECTVRSTCERFTCRNFGPRTPFTDYSIDAINGICGHRISVHPIRQAVADVLKPSIGGI